MQFEGEAEVVVLIKAAPEVGRVHGETVCVAGIDRYGHWHRLYPVAFKDLSTSQRFSRWDIVRFRWRRPSSDHRIESKRIDPQSVRVEGKVPDRERPALVERAIAASLENEEAAGRSLALIQPQNVRFVVRQLTTAELAKSTRRRQAIVAQMDMLSETMIPREAPPYSFSYEFDHAGRRRKHLCIDWETEATFFKWRQRYGEELAIEHMKRRWGEEIPSRGLLFAMGTHRVTFWRKWLLSGVVQVRRPQQGQLF